MKNLKLKIIFLCGLALGLAGCATSEPVVEPWEYEAAVETLLPE